MPTQPLVSVLMPLYNKADFVAEAIESVLNQTYPNIEIIIVDDGSTDNGFEIAKRYESTKIFLFKQENKGVSSARNTAFRHSKGDFIQFLDADDVIDRQKIAEQVKILRGSLDALTTAQCVDFKVLKDGQKQTFERPLLRKNYADPLAFLMDEVRQGALVHSWLIPRYLMKKAGLWDETMTIYEDRDLYLKLLPCASQIIYCHSAICYWRLPTSSEHHSQRNSISDTTAALHYISRFETKMFNNTHTHKEEIRLALACLYKKLLFVSRNSNPIVSEIRNRCIRLNLIPDCSTHPIIKIISKVFGIRMAFEMVFFQVVIRGKLKR